MATKKTAPTTKATPRKKSSSAATGASPKVVSLVPSIDPDTLTSSSVPSPPAPANGSETSFFEKAEVIQDRIADTLAGLDLPPSAKLEGARLAEAWINENHKFDLQFKTVAVEVPFFMFPEKYTVVCGVMDKQALKPTSEKNGAPSERSGEGSTLKLFGNEWKTVKGTTRYYNEDKWFEKIRHGHQTGVYALAMHEAYFVLRPESVVDIEAIKKIGKLVVPCLGSDIMLWQPGIQHPEMMVRAITKEQPPAIWPSDKEKAFFKFSNQDLTSIRNALAIKGAQLRTAKLSGLTPWQMVGLQCENRFSHTMCPFYEQFCKDRKHPDGNVTVPGPTDPGWVALQAASEMLRVSLDDPKVVVLTASSYDDVSNCMEMYRLQGQFPKENFYQDELNKGSAFHAAVATYYKEVGK